MEFQNDIQWGDLLLRKDHPFLIAEAGVNYENDLETALTMVEEAASAGADAIKFQSYKAEKIASKFSPSYWDLSKEPTTSQFELFKKFDSFGIEEYTRLAEKARECGILFMSTPFDFEFADQLDPLLPAYKIASADITNLPFLSHCARRQKPMILSVGASTIAEVDEAVAVIKAEGNDQIALLHCILSYPTAPANANLGVIRHLQGIFRDYIIGYSDHVPPHFDCLALTTAWSLGARILEKHFTLDKTKAGNDHYHAMDPDDIRRFRRECAFMGELMGSRTKQVFPCEAESRKQARRSLVAGRTFAAGEMVATGNIQIKRPGTGIEPKHMDIVTRLTLKRDVQQDEILQWDMFTDQ